MNANLHKAIVLCTVTRSRLWNIPLDEALTISLEKAGATATETERRRLLRHAQAFGSDKQLELAI